jgi:hypothetical protein
MQFQARETTPIGVDIIDMERRHHFSAAGCWRVARGWALVSMPMMRTGSVHEAPMIVYRQVFRRTIAGIDGKSHQKQDKPENTSCMST